MLDDPDFADAIAWRIKQLLKGAHRPSFKQQCRAFISGMRRLAFYLWTPNERFPQPFAHRYVVLFNARWFNLPPKCEPPHYDWVTWVRGQISPDIELWAHESGATPEWLPTYRRTNMALPGLIDSACHHVFQMDLLWMTADVLKRWSLGDWRAPLLFRDLIEAEHCKRTYLAEAYFFLSQFTDNRPLWTYVAEQRGARVCLVHYSHNFRIDFSSERPTYGPAHARAYWPECIVMTDQCGAVLREAGSKITRYTQIKDVTIVDTGARITLPPGPLVAVIDIDPQENPKAYCQRDTVLAFLEAASKAIVAAGAIPVWKTKGALRPDDYTTKPSDIRIDAAECMEIANRYGAIVCPFGTPIQWISDRVSAAVVMPFTSPATTFRQRWCAAAYFDVTGTLGHQYLYARSNKILTTSEQLLDWLKKEVEQQPIAELIHSRPNHPRLVLEPAAAKSR